MAKIIWVKYAFDGIRLKNKKWKTKYEISNINAQDKRLLLEFCEMPMDQMKIKCFWNSAE